METTDSTNLMNLVYRYTRALSRWIKAGRPVRREDEIEAIFTDYCGRCEYLDQEYGRCKICGCHVGLRAAPLLNKIAMATEHCPNGTW